MSEWIELIDAWLPQLWITSSFVCDVLIAGSMLFIVSVLSRSTTAIC